MKKLILLTPLTLFLCTFHNSNLEAAGCSTHQNKSVEIECSIMDDNCKKLKTDKKINKVDV
tara:strand:- start:673 stop:855 length:183 start_codon:yes stop_codon:yes gene_type:complete